MDFVTAWKAISIVLTGAFGILGLLKDFKDRATDKITVWGRVSLIGILASTLLGVAAQLKESSDQEKSSNEVSKQTLKLVSNTETSVRDIQRMLSPIDEPRFILLFKFSCTDLLFKGVCSNYRATANYFSPPPKIWSYWPGGPNVSLPVFMEFFDNEADARNFAKTGMNNSHLEYIISGVRDAHQKTLGLHISPQVKIGTLQIVTDKPDYANSDRKFVSTIDLRGKIILIAGKGIGDNKLTLSLVSIKMKNGQELVVQGPEITRIPAEGPRGSYAYLYKFPG